MGLLLAVCTFSLLSSFVSAQCSGPRTITTNADAESISQCQRYTGDITIGIGASGNIHLNGIETITGNLTAADASSLISLNADNITSIGGTLRLSNLTRLSDFGFPLLERVQTLAWTGLPSLEGLSFDTGLTEVESVYISNTGLINLSGLTPVVVGSIDVNNNAYLETVGLNDLVNATSTLSFRSNAPNLVIQFESLQFVSGSLFFRNISGLSVPDLQNVTGSFVCHSCAMATFKATWVQSVGGTFAFVSTDLQTLEFPDLTYVGGGFQLANNSQLAGVSGFPLLDTVGSSMILNGVFSSIDLSSLDLVQGSVEVATTSSNETICKVFNDFHTDHVIKGSVNCRTSVSKSAAANLTSNVDAGTNSTSSSNTTVPPSGSSGLRAGAIAGIVIGVLALLALVGITVFFLYRRRSRNTPPPSQPELRSDDPPKYAQLPATEHETKAEMYVDPRDVTEMRAQEKFPAELESETGGKRIPGVYEIEGDSGPSPVENRRGNTMDMLSPISPIGGTVASGSGDGTAGSNGAAQSHAGGVKDRLLQ